MKLDDIEDVKNLLTDIKDLFNDIDDVKKQIEEKITLANYEQEDYLHELELGKLNGIEIMRISKELIRVRKERRELKNKLEFINTIKGYTDKYITKGIVADTKQASKNIDSLIKNQENKRVQT